MSEVHTSKRAEAGDDGMKSAHFASYIENQINIYKAPKISLAMGIKALLAYTTSSALAGAVAGYIAQAMDYDLSITEGMRQVVIAGLPLAALAGSIESKSRSEVDEWTAESPYAVPALVSGIFAGLYFFGGLGMEYLTQTNISQGFTTIVGGIEGLICGTSVSIQARSERKSSPIMKQSIL